METPPNEEPKKLGEGIALEAVHELPPPPPEHATSQELLENMIAEQRANENEGGY